MQLLLLLLLLGGNANNCQVCHSDIKVQFTSSIHSKENLSCTSCHNGDPAAATEDAAHKPPFRSLRDRKQIPAVCSECHADAEKMKPYGLPTDQFALYQTSNHGKALARGDTNVAVCTDCHGVHKILPAQDPESQTHARNIAETCGKCHANAGLMEKYHLSASTVREYNSSIHANALQSGNPNAPVCVDCHGTHGATPPGIGDVSIVCGHCHQAERDSFRASPHARAMAASGIAECAACHGNHAIQKTTTALWSSACNECHEPNSIQVKRGQEIRQQMEKAVAEIATAEKVIQQAAEIPLAVSDYEARLEEARTYLVQVRPVTHSLIMGEIQDLTRHSISVSTEIRAEIGDKQKIFKMRRVVLFVVWFYLLLTVVIIYQFRKQLESNRSEE